ncbi:MAG: PspC domain-containing protein [Candidatus Yanofskybacteria bacterium]|nr:PspC domain-containing protein [Candidatus Yanofskybacteria bacterium]
MMQFSHNRKLYRSRRDRVIAGVCSGIAWYFGIDAVFIRLLFLLLAFGISWGPAVMFYFVLVLAIPEDRTEQRSQPRMDDPGRQAWQAPGDWFSTPIRVVGAIMVTIGLVGLFNQPLTSIGLDWRLFWPIAFVGIGLLLSLRSGRSRSVAENPQKSEN